MKKFFLLFVFAAASMVAMAATITSNVVTGNWSDGSTWADGVVPTVDDDVIIAVGANITLTADATCKTLTLNGGTTAANVILNGFSLNVSGAIDLKAPTANVTTNTLNIGTGSLIAGSIVFRNPSNDNQKVLLAISTGSAVVNGSLDFQTSNNIPRRIINITGNGSLTLKGAVTYTGTYSFDASSTVTYESTGNSNNILNATYGNLIVKGGTKTLLGAVTVATSLTMDGSILKLNGNSLNISNGGTITQGVSNPFSNTNMIDVTSGINYGQLTVNSNTAAGFVRSYPIGLNGIYSPLVISAFDATVNTGGSIRIRVAGTKHALISGDNYVKRYWDITTTNITAINSMTGYLQYDDSDVVGTESSITRAAAFISGTWTNGSVNSTTNQIALHGTTLTGQWTAAGSSDFSNPTGKYTVADGNWNANATWNGNAQPLASDDVLILHNVSLNSAARSAANMTILAGGRIYDNNNTSSALTLSGTLNNYGILYDQHGGGANTFTGKITNHTGAEFNVASTSNTVSGGIENNGSFSMANATFNVSQTLSGSGFMYLGPASGTGSLTIPDNVTVTNRTNVQVRFYVLNGATATSSWVNDENSLLEYNPNDGTNIPMSTGIFNATAANNTVKYLRGNAQAFRATDYWHLSIEGGNTKTLSANTNMTIYGNMTVANGTTVSLAATDATPTITIEGKLDNSSATLNLWASGTRYANVVLTGEGEIISGTGTTKLGTLTANNVSAKSSSGNHTISFHTTGGGFINNGGEFNGTTNFTFNQPSNLAQQIGGTGNIITSGTLSVGANGSSANQVTQTGNVTVGALAMNCGSSGFYDVAGNSFTLSGFSSSNVGDNIRFSTTSDLTINGTNAVNINRVSQTGTYNNLRNLTINNTSTSISTAKVKVNNTLTLAQGTFTSLAANIEMADGAKIVRSGGTITNAPNIPSGKITVEYTGNTDRTAGSELVSGKLSNIKVLEGHLSLDAATLTADASEVSAGARLTLNSGKSATIGSFTLKSDENGTATFVDANTNGNLTTTNATVQQWVTAGRNWYISPSVTAASYTSLNRGSKVAQWNESSKTWTDVVAGTLTAGRGYIQVANADQGTTGTVNFVGTTNTGNVDVAVSRTESGASRGFNLVGNPYPSYLSWTDFYALTQNANALLNSFWFRTKNNSNQYAFTTYNGTSHEVVGGGSVPTDLNSFIPPMQAFWVRVKQNTDDQDANYPNNIASIRFANNMRHHADVVGNSSNNRFKAPANNQRARLRLQLSNGDATDEALLYFDAAAANAFDSYDSPKMLNNSATMPDVYSLASTERLAINGLSGMADNMLLPLGFTLRAAATLNFKVSEMSNFESNQKVYLVDNVRNTQTELYAGVEYSFSIDQSTNNNESRFALLLKAPGTSTNTNNIDNAVVRAYANASQQIVIHAPASSQYVIYNAMGQQLESGTLQSMHETLRRQYAAGIYVVKVNSVAKKIIVE